MQSNKIGLWSATFLGISTIIGSGWLFAPYKAAAIAGPAALLSWLIAALIISLLALCFSEIAGLYPTRGLSAIISTLSHHKYFGFPFALANWLGVIAVVALEAEATIQYLITLAPHIAPVFFQQDQFTLWGDLLAIFLTLVFSVANFWGIRVLAKTNNIFALLKIVIPVLTALMMLSVAYHPHNLTIVGNTFAPYGYTSIFSAILTCGIVVAFNGFQTVVSFAHEIKDPHKTIPISILLALLFCLVVYLLLQAAFILSMPPELLKQGWNRLDFVAPMVQLPVILGLGFLSTIIYFGATAAPCGSGIAFMGTASRMFTAMSQQNQMPRFFYKIHPIYGISHRSLIFNTALSILFLFLFRSWSEIAIVLGLLHVLSYLPIPLALIVFRKKLKSYDIYPFKIPYGKFIAFVVFVTFTCLFLTAPYKPVLDLFIIFGLFQLVFIAVNIKTMKELKAMVRQSGLLILFFVGMLCIIKLAPQNSHVLSTNMFVLVSAIFATLFFFILGYSERDNAELAEVAVNLYR